MNRFAGTRIRVLALMPSLHDTSPGQRFRLEQWEPFLRTEGIDIDFQPFEDSDLHSVLHKPGETARKLQLALHGFMRRARLVRNVGAYDVIYVLREAALLGPPLFEYLLARSGVPVLFDFDDAIFVSYRSPSNGYLSLLKFPSKTRTICRLATHVMVGNEYLAEYARAANSQVTIVPTTIDTDKYRPRSRPPSRPLVIGWSGSHSTVQHLDVLRSVLSRLAEKENFQLKVIGTDSYRIPGVKVDAKRWSSEHELGDLREFDIGVMPLPDDNWSKGKCGLKALQYMALGIPTVCSAVGVNTEIVVDGRNGFLATSENEWVEKLTALLRSSDLRGRLGTAGKATVEAEYSAAVHAPRVADLVRSLAPVARQGA